MSEPVRPGPRILLLPKLRGKLHRDREGGTPLIRKVVLGVLGLGFWGLLFVMTTRMLLYFRGVEGLGEVLAARMLGLVLLECWGWCCWSP